MQDLKKALSHKLIADGAMGTQLFELGLEGDCPECFNLTNPEQVFSIHKSYVDAGAELIYTNTFGASEWKLEKSGQEASQSDMIRAACEIARSAAAGQAYVLGDIGPTGELPAPYGTHDIAEFDEIFRRQCELLAESGVDGVVVETMSSSDEAVAAVRAAKRAGLVVLATFSYTGGRNGFRTMMGESVADATRKALDAGADAVGANCGLGAAEMADVIREVRAVTSGPVIAKPNAGRPRLEGARTVFDEPPEDWAKIASSIAHANSCIIGGCCGTTPEHIKVLKRLLFK